MRTIRKRSLQEIFTIMINFKYIKKGCMKKGSLEILISTVYVSKYNVKVGKLALV